MNCVQRFGTSLIACCPFEAFAGTIHRLLLKQGPCSALTVMPRNIRVVKGMHNSSAQCILYRFREDELWFGDAIVVAAQSWRVTSVHGPVRHMLLQ